MSFVKCYYFYTYVLLNFRIAITIKQLKNIKQTIKGAVEEKGEGVLFILSEYIVCHCIENTYYFL